MFKIIRLHISNDSLEGNQKLQFIRIHWLATQRYWSDRRPLWHQRTTFPTHQEWLTPSSSSLPAPLRIVHWVAAWDSSTPNRWKLWYSGFSMNRCLSSRSWRSSGPRVFSGKTKSSNSHLRSTRDLLKSSNQSTPTGFLSTRGTNR